MNDRKNPPLAINPMASTIPAIAAKPVANERALRSSLFMRWRSNDPDRLACAFEPAENVRDLFAAMFRT
jgi:hypothetical protein